MYRRLRIDSPHACLTGTIILVALLTASPALSRANDGDSPNEAGPILAASDPPAQAFQIDGPEILRKRYVTLDVERVLRSRSLQLDLFSDKSLDVQRTESGTMGESGRIWTGHVTGHDDGQVLLASVGDVLAGVVYVGREVYAIRYAGDGVHAVVEIDPRQPSGHAPSPVPPIVESPQEPFERMTDPCNVVDVLIAYTSNAEDAIGGRDVMEADIYLTVHTTNYTFEKSNVDLRVNPVHLMEVAYTEAPGDDLGTDLLRLTDGTSGLDVVRSARETHCADVVTLVGDFVEDEDNDIAGYSWIQEFAPDPTHAIWAYSVMDYRNFGWKMTYAHELGHLFGARHDWYVDDLHTPFTYGHGYVNVDEQWGTVMSYGSLCEDSGGTMCARAPRWSSPDVLFWDLPTGIAQGTSTDCIAWDMGNPDCDAENTEVLEEVKCIVARFKNREDCQQTGNVWMKDTWEDTGAEPDPLTAAQDMWHSPYIWNRIEEDAEQVHQHQHENPVINEPAHVYVKLHNDFGVPATGDLKVYWARSSTGLVWPDHWTLFSDKEVTIPAHSTLIADPDAWIPTEIGHHCLLARWEMPGDPMTFPEGADVEANTRGNNNIAWRNLHVDRFLPESSGDVAPAIVRNIDGQSSSVDLVVRQPDLPDNFLRSGGRIFLDMAGLYGPWSAAGAHGSGFVPYSPPIVEIVDTPSALAVLAQIPMAPGSEMPVHFKLETPSVVSTGPVTHPSEDGILFCSPGGLPIPDDDPVGVEDFLTIEPCLEINDLNLHVEASHTWVGDISFTLKQATTGKIIEPIHRPGVPASTYGCSGDDIDVILSDEGDASAEPACSTPSPALQGVLAPSDPGGTLFDSFDGETVCGDWSLTVVDHADAFTGTLGEWCIEINAPHSSSARPIAEYSLHLVQYNQFGDQEGGVGYLIQIEPAGPAGGVPNGATRPGTPLTVRLGGVNEIKLNWGPSCAGTDTGYAVYRGDLGDFKSHAPVECGLAATSKILPLETGNHYFLVAPQSPYFEGSHGLRHNGAERPPGTTTCMVQLVGGCEGDPEP